MTKNQIDRMMALLQELRQTLEELDCGPLECHACVDTDDYAYIEVAIDGDGAARTISDWAFALSVLVGLANTEWATGQLYEAFRQTLLQTSTNPDEALPEWEEVEALIEEQARLRDAYFNLLYFLEHPEEYADFLRRETKTLMEKEGMSLVIAKAQVASRAMAAFKQELEMAYGEKATPRFHQMYQTHLNEGGEDFTIWFAKWLSAN